MPTFNNLGQFHRKFVPADPNRKSKWVNIKKEHTGSWTYSLEKSRKQWFVNNYAVETFSKIKKRAGEATTSDELNKLQAITVTIHDQVRTVSWVGRFFAWIGLTSSLKKERGEFELLKNFINERKGGLVKEQGPLLFGQGAEERYEQRVEERITAHRETFRGDYEKVCLTFSSIKTKEKKLKELPQNKKKIDEFDEMIKVLKDKKVELADKEADFLIYIDDYNQSLGESKEEIENYTKIINEFKDKRAVSEEVKSYKEVIKKHEYNIIEVEKKINKEEIKSLESEIKKLEKETPFHRKQILLARIKEDATREAYEVDLPKRISEGYYDPDIIPMEMNTLLGVGERGGLPKGIPAVVKEITKKFDERSLKDELMQLSNDEVKEIMSHESVEFSYEDEEDKKEDFNLFGIKGQIDNIKNPEAFLDPSTTLGELSLRMVQKRQIFAILKGEIDIIANKVNFTDHQKQYISDEVEDILDLYLQVYKEHPPEDAYLLCRDIARVIAYQEHFDKATFTGSDHGGKHVRNNAKNCDEVHAGMKSEEDYNLKDKLMEHIIHAYHDTGYTTGLAQKSFFAMKDHPPVGARVIASNKDYFINLLAARPPETERDKLKTMMWEFVKTGEKPKWEEVKELAMKLKRPSTPESEINKWTLKEYRTKEDVGNVIDSILPREPIPIYNPGEEEYKVLHDCILYHAIMINNLHPDEKMRSGMHPNLIRSVTSISDACAVTYDRKTQEFWEQPAAIIAISKLKIFLSLFPQYLKNLKDENAQEVKDAHKRIKNGETVNTAGGLDLNNPVDKMAFDVFTNCYDELHGMVDKYDIAEEKRQLFRSAIDNNFNAITGKITIGQYGGIMTGLGASENIHGRHVGGEGPKYIPTVQMAPSIIYGVLRDLFGDDAANKAFEKLAEEFGYKKGDISKVVQDVAAKKEGESRVLQSDACKITITKGPEYKSHNHFHVEKMHEALKGVVTTLEECWNAAALTLEDMRHVLDKLDEVRKEKDPVDKFKAYLGGEILGIITEEEDKVLQMERQELFQKVFVPRGDKFVIEEVIQDQLRLQGQQEDTWDEAFVGVLHQAVTISEDVKKFVEGYIKSLRKMRGNLSQPAVDEAAKDFIEKLEKKFEGQNFSDLKKAIGKANGKIVSKKDEYKEMERKFNLLKGKVATLFMAEVNFKFFVGEGADKEKLIANIDKSFET